jgi:hypothetical protein
VLRNSIAIFYAQAMSIRFNKSRPLPKKVNKKTLGIFFYTPDSWRI